MMRFLQGCRLDGNNPLSVVFFWLESHHCPSTRLCFTSPPWVPAINRLHIWVCFISPPWVPVTNHLQIWIGYFQTQKALRDPDHSITMVFLILKEFMGCTVVEGTFAPAGWKAGPKAQGLSFDKPWLLFLSTLLSFHIYYFIIFVFQYYYNLILLFWTFWA